jgi:hypothetical protein
MKLPKMLEKVEEFKHDIYYRSLILQTNKYSFFPFFVMIFTKENYDPRICEICHKSYNKAKTDFIYNVCSRTCFDLYMDQLLTQFKVK